MLRVTTKGRSKCGSHNRAKSPLCGTISSGLRLASGPECRLSNVRTREGVEEGIPNFGCMPCWVAFKNATRCASMVRHLLAGGRRHDTTGWHNQLTHGKLLTLSCRWDSCLISTVR